MRELAMPAMKPEPINYNSLEWSNLLKIWREVSNTENSTAVPSPKKTYIEDAPL